MTFKFQRSSAACALGVASALLAAPWASAQGRRQAPQSEAPRSTATPAPRELVYVIVGHSPNGEVDPLIRALRAALERTEGASPAAPQTAAPTPAVTAERGPTPSALSTPPSWAASPTVSEPPAPTPAGEPPAAAPTPSPVREAPATPMPPPPRSTQISSGPGLVPWLLMASGGVALLGGAVLGGVVLDSTAELERRCSGSLCPPELGDSLSRTRTLSDVSTGLLIGGGAAAATGALVWLINSLGGRSSSERAPTATASCTGLGCTLGVTGRF